MSGLLHWLRVKPVHDDTTITEIAGAGASSASVPTPASDVEQRFVDQGEIARGGQCSVRKVMDRRLRRRSALKVLDPAQIRHPAQMQLFVEEAQITAQLDHPNIVPVHELGTDVEGVHYINMKLVRGETLSELVRRKGPLVRDLDQLREYLRLFTKVCDAIAFAHSRGVVHCDLKPPNLIVGDFGEIYVMDWGIARIRNGTSEQVSAFRGEDDGQDAEPTIADIDQAVHVSGGSTGVLDDTDAVFGSPHYMSPEQANRLNDAIGPRSDVYGLGGILYFMLTGEPPHTGELLETVMYHAMIAKVAPPQEVVGDLVVPPPLSRIAMKALSRAPEDRYQTALELKADIERFLEGQWDLDEQAFAAGTIIVSEGDEGQSAYIIKEGRCEVFTMVGDSRQVLRSMGPGEVFGETAIFSDSPRSASVEATEDVVLQVVTRQSLTDGLALGSWMGAFVKALAERFIAADGSLRRASTEPSETAR